jgi:hypothetical protein
VAEPRERETEARADAREEAEAHRLAERDRARQLSHGAPIGA